MAELVVLMMAKPYEGQADKDRLTAREGWGDPRAHGASVTRLLRPSQRGPATRIGIRRQQYK